jgi:hypothetical protein
MPGSTSGHRIARRLYPATVCACGATERLQHHHVDGNPANNEAGNVAVVCQQCHTDAHVANRTWGRMARIGA